MSTSFPFPPKKQENIKPTHTHKFLSLALQALSEAGRRAGAQSLPLTKISGNF